MLTACQQIRQHRDTIAYLTRRLEKTPTYDLMVQIQRVEQQLDKLMLAVRPRLVWERPDA